MKKILILLVSVLINSQITGTVFAKEDLNLYFFTAKGCPHCAEEKEYLEDLKKTQDFEIKEFEVTESEENLELLKKFISAYGAKNVSAPILYIGDDYFVGFDKDLTAPKIREKIEFYTKNPCPDPLNKIEEVVKCEEEEKKEIVKVPFLGEINLFNYSLPAITIILGLLDGFNPCAMWVLLALLTLLISVGNKKKIWLIGGLFIFITGIIYFGFMAAWLNIFFWLGFLKVIRIIIALVAVGAGIWYLRSFITFREGVCEVTSDKQEKSITERIQNLLKQNSFLAIIVGVVILAFTVNMIELLCTIGLPAIYTKILTLSELSTAGYYGYLALYTVFYQLDDVLMFVVAVTTLNLLGLTGKYSKYSRLIGGILMIILGILLLLKPELLMFN